MLIPTHIHYQHLVLKRPLLKAQTGSQHLSLFSGNSFNCSYRPDRWFRAAALAPFRLALSQAETACFQFNEPNDAIFKHHIYQMLLLPFWVRADPLSPVVQVAASRHMLDCTNRHIIKPSLYLAVKPISKNNNSKFNCVNRGLQECLQVLVPLVQRRFGADCQRLNG